VTNEETAGASDHNDLDSASQPMRLVPDGFESFYEEFRASVYRALRVAGARPEEADDATAEAFARALVAWNVVARHPNPRAWVMTVALREYWAAWRRWEARVTHVSVEMAPQPGPELAIDPHLIHMIGLLPARQREVVALRDLCGFNTNETADVLGIRQGTVTNLLYRAHETLRAKLGDTRGQEMPHD
jgi:RNA polymerase sigma factor (sigma-70 family)